TLFELFHEKYSPGQMSPDGLHRRRSPELRPPASHARSSCASELPCRVDLCPARGWPAAPSERILAKQPDSSQEENDGLQNNTANLRARFNGRTRLLQNRTPKGMSLRRARTDMERNGNTQPRKCRVACVRSRRWLR